MENPVIDKEGTDLRIRIRWSSLTVAAVAGLLAVGVFFSWRSGQLGRALAAFRPGAHAGFASLLVAAIPFLFMAFALLALAYAIVRTMNATEIQAREASLSSRHGPLPWFAAGVELDPADIEEFLLVRRLDRPAPGSQRGHGLGGTYGGSLEWYRLGARVRREGRTVLVSLSPALESDTALGLAGKALAERYGKPFGKLRD